MARRQEQNIQRHYEPIVSREDRDFDEWEARFPISSKSPNNPEAVATDKAHEYFLEGIRAAQSSEGGGGGDSEQGLVYAREYFAAAYLTEERVFVVDGCSETACDDAIAHESAMDLRWFKAMLERPEMRNPGNRVVVSSIIIHVIAALEMSGKISQLFMGVALKGLDSLIEKCEGTANGANIANNPDCILGCVTLPRLLYFRGVVLGCVGNGKKALRDFTKAAEMDPTYLRARLCKIHHWFALKAKSYRDIHSECLSLLNDIHEDYSDADILYALLSVTTLKDPRLGTYEDAMSYYGKSLRATERRVELYGPRSFPDDTIQHVRHNFGPMYLDPGRESCRARRQADIITSRLGASVDATLGKDHGRVRHKKNKCLNCGKDEEELGGIKLSKCSRCKKIYYCGRECQVENWKEHKLQCKIFCDDPKAGH